VPLLQRIRAFDRHTLVASSSQTAKAYESITDSFLDEQSLIDLTVPIHSDIPDEAPLDGTTDGSSDGAAESVNAVLTRSEMSDQELVELRERAAALTVAQVEASTVPVKLAMPGQVIRKELGNEVVDRTEWLGVGTMRSAILADSKSHLSISAQGCGIPIGAPSLAATNRQLSPNP
jgi:hypothetical protein